MGYSHLYDTSVFVSPSAKRSYEDTLPVDNNNANIGIAMVKGNHSIGEMGSSQSFIKDKLQNKDVYQKMKNKAVYSANFNVMAHAGLNKL